MEDQRTTTRLTNVVAVTENVPEAGIISWWTLSGVVNADALRNAWTAAGLDPKLCPDNPSPECALHRAVKELGERHKLVRPLGKSKGWSVVDELASGDNLDYVQGVSAKVDIAGRVTIEPADHPRAAEILGAYQTHLDHLATTDVSTLLTRMASAVSAVGLRDTGGIYFIPRNRLDEWRKIVGAIRSVSSHNIYEVPALASDEAVRAILDAVEREAATDATALEEALDSDSIGARALESRAQHCAEVEEKVAGYEELLGRSLAGLTTRLASLRARLAEAALAKAAEAEKANA